MKMSGSAWWRRVVVALSLAALVGAVLGPAALAGPAGTGIVELVVRTPGYELTGAGVSVPGYAMEDAPGLPMLPVYGTLVALPPTGDWEIVYQAIGSRVLDQHVAIAAVPAPDLSFAGPTSWTLRAEEDLPGAVPVVDRPNPGVYRTNGFHPAALVTAGKVIRQDGQRLLPLRVYPFQYNPVAGVFRYHPEIHIQVKIKASGAAAQAEAVVESPLVLAAPQGLTGSGGALRIRTGERGLYRLSYTDLVGAGVPVGDTVSFAMAHLGQPIDIEVRDGGDGRFDPGDRVVFYAEPYQGRYMTQNVYWFTWDGGVAGPRMARAAVQPTGTEPILSTITQTVRVEFDKSYYSTYVDLPKEADHFFDNPLYANESSRVVSTTYTLPLDDPLIEGEVALRVALHGGLDQPTSPDQSVAVALNGHPAGAFQWDGSVSHIITATVPAAWLGAAPDRLTLEAALDQLPDLTSYWVSPDWVEATYPARADAEGDRLYVAGVAAGLEGTCCSRLQPGGRARL